MSRAEERTKTYLVAEVRRRLVTVTQLGRVGPLVAPVTYLADLPGGALVAIDDPTLGRRVFEVKVVQRKNMGWEKPRG